MNLEKLYKLQSELDSYIIKNRNIVMSNYGFGFDIDEIEVI